MLLFIHYVHSLPTLAPKYFLVLCYFWMVQSYRKIIIQTNKIFHYNSWICPVSKKFPVCSTTYSLIFFKMLDFKFHHYLILKNPCPNESIFNLQNTIFPWECASILIIFSTKNLDNINTKFKTWEHYNVRLTLIWLWI